MQGFGDKIKEVNSKDNVEEEKEINIDDLILDEPKD